MIKKKQLLNAFILLLLFSTGNSIAQVVFTSEKEAIKAEKESKNQQKNSAKVKTMLSLSKWYSEHNNNSPVLLKKATDFANLSLVMSNALKYSEGIAESNLQLSMVSQQKKNYKEGKLYAQKAIVEFGKIKQQDKLGESWVMLWSNNVLSGMPYQGRIVFLDSAEVAFHRAGNKLREADCLKEKADIFGFINKAPEAILALKKALYLYKKGGNKRLYSIYDLLGVTYIDVADFTQGIKYSRLAVESGLEFGDTGMFMCTAYNRLGLAYYSIQENDSARVYFKKSLDIAEKYGDKNTLYFLAFNYANSLVKSNKNKEALQFVTAIIKKYPEFANIPNSSLQCLFVEIYIRTFIFDKADFYKRKIESQASIFESNGDNLALGEVYITLIHYNLVRKNMTNAQLYGEKFKKFADKLNSNLYYSDYHFAKFEIDSVGGNYLSAIKHYQTYKKFKEKLLDEKKRKEITKLNVLYETEKKDKNIESLKRQTVLQKENIKQAHKIQYFTFGMLLLALIIIYSMYRVYKHKQKTNIILEKQQDEINQQNISLQHLLTEKEWLLKEIHHRVKNNLHIVVGLLASQTEFLKGKEALLAIADSQRRIETMSLIHQKLYQSENLSMLGMPSYIFELTEYLKDSFDMDKSIRFKREIENIEFPLSHTIPIGLILNEAVTNAIKYAFLTVKEGIITITLKKLTSEHYILCIHDNGIGLPLDFDPYNSPTFGMKLMLGLSDDIKGNFKIVNDKGTKITLEFAITSETT